MYRQWGADVIGMTAMPEAKLAREAELPYALVGMVTDYDCWREGETVDVAEVVAQLQANAALARAMVANFITALPEQREPSPIDTVLDHAVITAPDAQDPAVLARLDAVGRRLFAARTGRPAGA
jgi:5'-methylthioadenosine phosphorylase